MSPCGGHDEASRVVSPSPPGSALGKDEDLYFVGFSDALTVPPSGDFVAFVLVVFVATFTIAPFLGGIDGGPGGPVGTCTDSVQEGGRRAVRPVSAFGITWAISSSATRPLLVPSWGPGVLVVRRLALSVIWRLALSVLSLLLLLRWRSAWLIHNYLRKGRAVQGRGRDKRSP